MYADMKFKTDKIAVVTGGARGIGRGICETLAKQGAKVVIADLLIDEAVATAAEIENSGGRAIAVKTDITDLVSVQAMVEAVKEEFGPVDILVNETLIAKGEVIVQNEKYGIRVTEITSRMDRIRSFSI